MMTVTSNVAYAKRHVAWITLIRAKVVARVFVLLVVCIILVQVSTAMKACVMSVSRILPKPANDVKKYSVVFVIRIIVIVVARCLAMIVRLAMIVFLFVDAKVLCGRKFTRMVAPLMKLASNVKKARVTAPSATMRRQWKISSVHAKVATRTYAASAGHGNTTTPTALDVSNF